MSFFLYVIMYLFITIIRGNVVIECPYFLTSVELMTWRIIYVDKKIDSAHKILVYVYVCRKELIR